jgi:FkbM family methyltransferase
MTRKLRQFSGKLIVVEPVQSFFNILLKNYSGIPGVAFENVAISDRNGPAWFYRLGVDPVEHGQPEFLSQLGSLKEERMKSLWDNYENMVECQDFYLKHRVKEKVNCITFTELISRHRLAKIDLLQIDVEGYEFEILKTIDFKRIPIRFINYENVLLQENKSNAEKLMLRNGYSLVDYGQDTLCYKKPDLHLMKTNEWSKFPLNLNSEEPKAP